MDPAAVSGPEYPALAQALTLAFRAEIDVDRLLPTLLAGGDYTAALVMLT